MYLSKHFKRLNFYKAKNFQGLVNMGLVGAKYHLGTLFFNFSLVIIYFKKRVLKNGTQNESEYYESTYAFKNLAGSLTV